MRVFINSNCPQEQVFAFDMLATATGLYKMADVVLDASESKNICIPLNTSYTLLLSSQTAGIEEKSLVEGLSEFHKNKQVKGICLKDKCDGFQSKTFNQTYPIDTFDALDLTKTFSAENISRSDVLILRERLKTGIYPPFYVRIPRSSELIMVNADGSMSYGDKDIFELTANNINEFISYSMERETLAEERCTEIFHMLDGEITPVYFDENVDIFNETVTPDTVIEYKKRFYDFVSKVANGDESQSYLGVNKNALMLYEMININSDVIKTLLK